MLKKKRIKKKREKKKVEFDIFDIPERVVAIPEIVTEQKDESKKGSKDNGSKNSVDGTEIHIID